MTDPQILERAGGPVIYEVEGEGPVALVLIAEPGIEQALGVIAHYLVAEAGFHVVRVLNFESASADARVDDISALLTELGIEDAWIGGHGSGGTIARVFVASHPERSNGLLLLGVEDSEIPLAPLLPVLIIQGADDEVTPPSHGEQLHASAPERTNLRTLSGADHLFPLSHPVQTATIIEEYLDWD